MAKTKQIGVRFDKILLDAVKDKHGDISPQRALNLYEDTYRKWAAGVFVVQEQSPNWPELIGKIKDNPKVKLDNLTNPKEKSDYAIDTTKEEQIKELEEKIKAVPQGQYYNKVVKSYRDKIFQLKK